MRRRRWSIAAAVVIVPAVAVALSLQQQYLYRASADVVLSHQNLAASLSNIQDPNLSVAADRLAATQADVARAPVIAGRVLDKLRLHDRTARDLLGRSSVSTATNADVLTFSVTDPNAPLARQLATEYARQYIVYRHQLETGPIQRAAAEVERRLNQLERKGSQSTPLYSRLLDKAQQLATIQTLQTSDAALFRGADSAHQVQPRPVRNGVIGLALGILLGVGFAFLWEALDTRVRSADEISDRLGLPLLARIPEPRKRMSGGDKFVMLDDPLGPDAEAFRVLRTNLEFCNLDRGAKTILVTSALEQEGKSTIASNLALALARTGKRVILVDLDLRKPDLARFFRLGDGPGLADVALGRASLPEALVPLVVVDAAQNDAPQSGNGRTDVTGVLEVLRPGPMPPDAGEFVASHALRRILDGLEERADVVLIDSPPLLRVGDTLTLTAFVDAVLVVARLQVLRRETLTELRRVLANCPVRPLGFVLTGAHRKETYGYGYGHRARQTVREAEREPLR